MVAPSTPPGHEITDEHVAGLADVDAAGYWWFVVRQSHVVAALQRATRAGEMALLDFGCGTGGVTTALADALHPGRLLGLDGTTGAVEIAAARGLDARYADFRQPLELPFAPNAITAMDVLEHLEDPQLALRNLAAAAAPDATLVVTVPAMPSLYSSWDDACGHYRRYTRRLLVEHLSSNGWRVERARHVFSYCVPPAWWERRVRKRVQEVEFPPVSPLVNRLMIAAGRFEKAIGCPFPFGTSVIAVARRA